MQKIKQKKNETKQRISEWIKWNVKLKKMKQKKEWMKKKS